MVDTSKDTLVQALFYQHDYNRTSNWVFPRRIQQSRIRQAAN